MATGDNNSAHQYGASRAQPLVRYPTTQERGPVNAGRIRAHDQTRVGTFKCESPFGQRLGHVQKKDRAQTVKAEALPHLGEEQSRKTARVPKETSVINGSRTGSSGIDWCAHSFLKC